MNITFSSLPQLERECIERCNRNCYSASRQGQGLKSIDPLATNSKGPLFYSELGQVSFPMHLYWKLDWKERRKLYCKPAITILLFRWHEGRAMVNFCYNFLKLGLKPSRDDWSFGSQERLVLPSAYHIILA